MAVRMEPSIPRPRSRPPEVIGYYAAVTDLLNGDGIPDIAVTGDTSIRLEYRQR